MRMQTTVQNKSKPITLEADDEVLFAGNAEGQ